jgi:TPR repeat protein
MNQIEELLQSGDKYLFETNNAKEAIKCFREAVKRGSVEAMLYLANIYDDGKVVPRCTAKTYKWYKQASKNGSHIAMFNIACMYYNKELGVQNVEKSFKWMLKSAQHGSIDGMIRVGDFYRDGTGISADLSLAYFWYLQASNLNNVDAMMRLGDLCENFPDKLKKYFEKSIQDNSESSFQLNISNTIIEFGIEFYQMAEAKGHTLATKNIYNIFNKYTLSDQAYINRYRKLCNNFRDKIVFHQDITDFLLLLINQNKVSFLYNYQSLLDEFLTSCQQIDGDFSAFKERWSIA